MRTASTTIQQPILQRPCPETPLGILRFTHGHSIQYALVPHNAASALKLKVRTSSSPHQRQEQLGLYKIFFYFEASVHESNMLIFLRPPAMARLLQYTRLLGSIRAPSDLLDAVHYTILVITISCTGPTTTHPATSLPRDTPRYFAFHARASHTICARGAQCRVCARVKDVHINKETKPCHWRTHKQYSTQVTRLTYRGAC